MAIDVMNEIGMRMFARISGKPIAFIITNTHTHTQNNGLSKQNSYIIITTVTSSGSSSSITLKRNVCGME